jgi:peptidoglycan-associated lipoprotein
MRQRNVFLSILLILMLVGVVGACKKQEPITEPTAPVEEPPPPPPPPPPTKEVEPDFPTEPIAEPEPTRSELIEQWNRSGVLATVYFAFDSSELSEAALQTLRENAEWLKAHADLDIVVEGHCDERGTIEYNLALGERRAGSVREYLTGLGLDRSRMRIITYGEERPVDPGHSESAWAKNRRAAFLIEQ